MFSNFFTLNTADLAKGLVVAALTAFLGMIVQALGSHGLDVGSYDWTFILNSTLTATGAYLTKNLFTAQNGKVFGHIG